MLRLQLDLHGLQRQLAQGQLLGVDVGLQVEGLEAVDRQQALLAPGLLVRCCRQFAGARCAGLGEGFPDLLLACGAGAVCLFGRQVAVEVELVELEVQAQCLTAEIGDFQLAAGLGLIEAKLQLVQFQVLGRAAEFAGQLEALEGFPVLHGRQADADAVEELAQVEGGNRQAAFHLRLLVEAVHFQFANGAQLIGRELQAVPFGNAGGQVGQQLALSGEGQGLALEGFAGGLAVELEVFQLITLEGAVETQLGLQFGLGAQYRLVAAQIGAECHGDGAAFADGAGGQFDGFGGELPAAARILIVEARVAQGQAVDVHPQRTGAVVLRRGGGSVGVIGSNRSLAGRRGGRAADLLPVAVAVLVALQGQIEAVDTDVAHLHFLAQQRQHAHRQAEQAQVGERLVRGAGAGQGGVGQFQAEPGEQAPADITADRQFQIGLVPRQLLDLVLVVVGIEQVGQGKAQRRQDQQDSQEQQAEDFAE